MDYAEVVAKPLPQLIRAVAIDNVFSVVEITGGTGRSVGKTQRVFFAKNLGDR